MIAAPLFAAGLEIGLRLAGYWAPNLGQPDLDTGWSLRPGAYGIVNRDGMRDREHPLIKPAGALRIALLGDSLCEASEVAQKDAFWSLLERNLAHCDALLHREIEVLNFGVAGYGTAQELIVLRTKVWKYSPDVVLLAFTRGDIVDNSRRLGGNPLSPYFVYRDGQLTADNSFRSLIRANPLRRAAAALGEYSRSVQLATELYRRARNAPAPIADTNSVDPEAWRVTEALLTIMRDEVSGHGARFWIATLGSGGPFYADLRIRDFARREGIPVFTVAPAVAPGHWNVDGHRAAGDILSAQVCAELRRS